MLRITKHSAASQSPKDTTILLKLEGKLLEPWIEELERSIHGAPAHPNALKLDLSALTFADTAGARFLLGLLRQGAMLTACSGYVAALLHVEKS